jgi:hypothetical protein
MPKPRWQPSPCPKRAVGCSRWWATNEKWLTRNALGELSEARTVTVGRLLEPPQSVHAEFVLLFVSDNAGGARLQAVRFAEGAEVLRGQTEKLQTLHYPLVLPPIAQSRSRDGPSSVAGKPLACAIWCCC